MDLEKKINRKFRALSDINLRAEFLESFAGGAGKAAGMGTVIILALLLVKLLDIDIASLTAGL